MNKGAAMTGLREMISDMEFVRDHTTDATMRDFAQESLDVANDYLAMEAKDAD